MCAESEIVRAAQLAIRAELDRRGIPLKVVASKAGVSMSTFLSWFPLDVKPQVMGLHGFAKLHGALPEDLLSLLLPDGFEVVRLPEGVDHDEFAEHCRAYLARKAEAHRADSPKGPALSDCEVADLDAHKARIGGAS
ncbi:MAG: hypothetical protein AAGB23_05365 [Pseudomonadota bacterium]